MDTEHLFREVFESHRDRIYRICCGYVHDKHDRDEVYQQTLIHIWSSLHTFQGRSQIGTWIYRITVNTCLRHLETERRKNAVFSGTLQKGEENIPDSSGFEETGRDEAAVRRLYDAINQLPAIDRILISLFLEDLSTKEMAEILEISEVNVRVKLHRIRRTLRNMMEGNNHGSR